MPLQTAYIPLKRIFMNRVLVHFCAFLFRICSDITAIAQSVLSRRELRYKVDEIAPSRFHVRIRTMIDRSKKVNKVFIYHNGNSIEMG